MITYLDLAPERLRGMLAYFKVISTSIHNFFFLTSHVLYKASSKIYM